MRYKINWGNSSYGYDIRCDISVEGHPQIKSFNFVINNPRDIKEYKLWVETSKYEFNGTIYEAYEAKRQALLAFYDKFSIVPVSGTSTIALKDSMESTLDYLSILADEVELRTQDFKKIETFIKTSLLPKQDVAADFIRHCARDKGVEIRDLVNRATEIDNFVFKGFQYEMAEYFLKVNDLVLAYELFIEISENDINYVNAHLNAAKIAANPLYYFETDEFREEAISWHCQKAGAEGEKFFEELHNPKVEIMMTDGQSISSLQAIIAQQELTISEQTKEIAQLHDLLEKAGISPPPPPLPPQGSEAITSSNLSKVRLFSTERFVSKDICSATTSSALGK